MDMDSDGEQEHLGCQDDDDAAIDVEADEEPTNDCTSSRPPTAPPPPLPPPPGETKQNNCLERNEVANQMQPTAIALDKSITHKTPHSY